MNLTEKIKTVMPGELAVLANQAAALAGEKDLNIYMVGGIVRDLLLGKPNPDLDLVLEGDAIAFAKEFTGKTGGKLNIHPKFNTAKITLNDWTVDAAMARTETYAQPGALPEVTPGNLKTDLFRRDFTVNAMAVCLSPDRYGELVDLYRGHQDLNEKIIRIIHEQSFIDDATRIWRAIRYEQRLRFQIEPETLRLLKRDTAGLKTVGGYRLKRELELVLKETEPETILFRADELGVLKELHPALKADEWLVLKFKAARQSGNAIPDIYLGLFFSRLNDDELTQLLKYLPFSADQARTIKEVRESN